MKIIIKWLPIKNLSPKVVFWAVNKWIRKSIITLEKTAKQETPVDKWFLRSAFRSRFSNLRWELYNTALYAPFVEFGTDPHIIRIKNKKALSDGKNMFWKVVHYPGTRANPFMERTVKKESSNIEKIILNELNKLYA